MQHSHCHEATAFPSANGSSGVVSDPEVSIVLPCLNEARTLGSCIQAAQAALRASSMRGEIIIADNGSTDNSISIARAADVRVVRIKERGYGNALKGGIEAARAPYVIIADADGSYSLGDLALFVGKLRSGYHLVVGNRFAGGIHPTAMPTLHRYLGNPMLSFLGRVLFGIPTSDLYCGLRAFERNAVLALGLQTSGMEFAGEMVIRASLGGLQICEVPTTLRPDGRDGPSHLRTWRDGWRGLRCMLLLSPRWLFLMPGVLSILLGLMWVMYVLRQSGTPGAYYLHSLFYAFGAIIVGCQSVLFALLGNTISMRLGIVPSTRPRRELFRHIGDRGVAFGGILVLAGVVLSLIVALNNVGASANVATQLSVTAALSAVVGVQLAICGLFVASLELLDERLDD